MKKAIRWGILMVAILAIVANAIIAWTPTSNIDGKNFYSIFNVTNVSAAKLFDAGNRVLTNQTILNVNSSVWWDGEDSQADLNVNSSEYWDEETSQASLNVNSSHFWNTLATSTEITALGTIVTGVWQATQIADAYLAALNANKLTNIPYLNYKILSYWVNITGRPTLLSNFTDDLDYSDKNVNSSQYWKELSVPSDLNGRVLSYWENISNKPGYLSNFTDDLDYSDKNVNSSQYWKELSVPSDLNGRVLSYWENISNKPEYLSNFTDDLGARGYTLLSNFSDDLGARGYTLLSNFTDDLGARGYTLLSNFSDDLDYSDKNTNSSAYWKELSVPSDLNGRVLSYWANISDAPTALSFFTDDLGARGYTLLSNFSDDLGTRGYTLLSNFSDDLGARGYTLLSNFSDDLDYSDKNVNSSVYWDEISSQNEITHTGNLTSLNVTGNITAPWFNGQILWDFIAGKFITAVGKFFYMSGTTLEMNTTELNETIDSRVAVASNLTVAGGIKLDGTTFSVEAGNGLEQETDGLKVADAGINDTLMKYKLGQNLTASDSPGFTNIELSGTLNPASNTTFGNGFIIPQGSYGCFDASCNHYIFENSSGVLIIA